MLGHWGCETWTAMLWTVVAFVRDGQSSAALAPLTWAPYLDGVESHANTPRHPTSAGQEWKAVRRWVARQDGILDPKVPARNNSDSCTPNCHRGSLGKSHHHPS